MELKKANIDGCSTVLAIRRVASMGMLGGRGAVQKTSILKWMH